MDNRVWRALRDWRVRALVTLRRPLYVPTYLWLPHADRTPLYLLSKLSGLFGAGGIVMAVVAAVFGVACALAQLDDRIDSWWLGMWAALVASVALSQRRNES